MDREKTDRLMRTFFLLLLFLIWGCPYLSAQSRFDYFYLEAEKQRLAGNYGSAAELYRHCLDINPDAPEALYSLSVILLNLRQDSVALDMLQRAASIDSGNPWYQETMAAVYLNRNRTEEAIPVLEHLTTLQSRRSDVLFRLMELYRGVGDTQKAIDALDRIEVLEGKNAQLSVEKFRLYMDDKRKKEAFQELQSLCDEFPHDLNYKVIVGNQYMLADEMDKAMAIYNEVREKDPTNLSLQMAMLDFYHANGQVEEYGRLRDSLLLSDGMESRVRTALMYEYVSQAVKDSALREPMECMMETVLSRPDCGADMLLLKAAYQKERGDEEKQIMETVRKVLEVEPNNQAALLKLLAYYGRTENYTELEHLCRNAMNVYPEELAFASYLGLALYQQDRTDEVAKVYEQALMAKPEDSNPRTVSEMYSMLGTLYYQKGRKEESFAAFDSSLVYMEDNITCLNDYAYFLSLSDERLDKAEEMSFRTLKAEPNNAAYLDTYAWILFRLKRYAEARIYIDRVVRPERGDDELMADSTLSGNLLEHAGDIYFHCDHPELALKFWTMAVKKGDASCSAFIEKKVKHKKYME